MTDIDNYCPSSLLFVIYNLFMKNINNRQSKKSDFYQLEGAAGVY